MPVVAPPALSAPPTSPDRNDPATFIVRAFALDDFRKNTEKPEYAALAANVFANATDAFNSAGAAVTSKNAAATSEVNAATSAAQAAATAGAPLWVTGTAYTLFAKRTSTVNGLIYNRIVAGAGAVDPALDTVNWAPLALPLPPQLLFSIGVI